jgi:hypothetical protein
MEEFASFNRRVAHAKVLSTKDIPMGWISWYIYLFIYLFLFLFFYYPSWVNLSQKKKKPAGYGYLSFKKVHTQ